MTCDLDIRGGLARLPDDELLALLISPAGRGVRVARRLLRDFGGLDRLAAAQPNSILRVAADSAVAPALIQRLAVTREIARRTLVARAGRRPARPGQRELEALAVEALAHHRDRRFVVFHVDATGQLISQRIEPWDCEFALHAKGQREILGYALMVGAHAVITASRMPLKTDAAAFADALARLRKAAALFEIRFDLHIAIDQDGACSRVCAQAKPFDVSASPLPLAA
ncbi:hypothetical protein [Brevundimonas sp.]|uniref:hypothetical protein n=1 Tax=Brevundimonas sp. TaxID=1871086 RepID=UPI0035B351E0